MELHKQVKLPANNQLLVFIAGRDLNK
jgi:hypothetical protein